MGRTNISAGRMAREPSVPKPIPVQPPPPTTTGTGSTPEATIPHPPFSPQHTSSPPSKPDTQNRANKPEPLSTRTPPLTLRSGKKIAPPLTGAQAKVAKPQPTSTLTLARTRLLTLRSGKKIVPPLTRARVNTLTVDSLPSSSSDEAECEEAASNSPEPKRKKIACGQMQLRNSPKCDNAVKAKQRPRIVDDESMEHVAPLTPASSSSSSLSPSHFNGDNSSLRTSVTLLTTAVVLNTRVLKRQEAQLNRLEAMVRSLSNKGM